MVDSTFIKTEEDKVEITRFVEEKEINDALGVFK